MLTRNRKGSHMATQIARRRFTVEDYHRMAEAGILTEDDRVELIAGEVVEMTPIGGPHMGRLNNLVDLLANLAPAGPAPPPAPAAASPSPRRCCPPSRSRWTTSSASRRVPLSGPQTLRCPQDDTSQGCPPDRDRLRRPDISLTVGPPPGAG